MPLFRPKTNKTLIVDAQKSITLDNKHNEILETFQDDENTEIPRLMEKKKTLKNIHKE